MIAMLIDGKIVRTDDTAAWAEWIRLFANRRIGNTVLNRRKKIWVSTVFLGIEHPNYSDIRRPAWFETMVFGTSIDGAQDRYHTLREAERGHAIWVGRARRARQVKPK